MNDRPVVISGCYIVRDEEAALGSSLAALAPFVDELVVYDTGSGDDTRTIARAHGARVHGARLVGGSWDDAFASVAPASLPAAVGLPAARTALDCALTVADADGGRRWLVPLRAWGEAEPVCRDLTGRLAFAAGEHPEALPLLRDGAGEFARPELVFECLQRLQRWDEVADVIIARVADGTSELPVDAVLEHVLRSEGGLQRLAAALPGASAKPYVKHVENLQWEVGGAFVEALWDTGRAHPDLLWAMNWLWSTMPVERALVWSRRLREAGLEQLCPLRRILRSRQHDDRSRVLSGAVLVEGGDVAVLPLVRPLLERLDDATAEVVLPELRLLAPGFAAALEPV